MQTLHFVPTTAEEAIGIVRTLANLAASNHAKARQATTYNQPGNADYYQGKTNAYKLAARITAEKLFTRP